MKRGKVGKDRKDGNDSKEEKDGNDTSANPMRHLYFKTSFLSDFGHRTNDFPCFTYFCAMRKLKTTELGRLSVDEFREKEKLPIIAVLENIRSGYNVGSFFRTADAFLLEAIYLVGYTAFPPHKEIRKTALGAEDTVSWKHFKTAAEALADLQSMGYSVYAIEQASGSHELQHFSEGGKVAVVFGNEVTGVEQSTIEACNGCIEIPQLGMKHSLNVATAGGIVLWELVRSRLLTDLS